MHWAAQGHTATDEIVFTAFYVFFDNFYDILFSHLHIFYYEENIIYSIYYYVNNYYFFKF